MACGCRKRSGELSTVGVKVQGYEVTYPDGATAPNLFLTQVEAKKEIRRRGGGTIRQITSGA